MTSCTAAVPVNGHLVETDPFVVMRLNSDNSSGSEPLLYTMELLRARISLCIQGNGVMINFTQRER